MGAALLRRVFFAHFTGVFAHGWALSGAFSGGRLQAGGPPDGPPAFFGCSTPPWPPPWCLIRPDPPARCWTFARRSGTVPWQGHALCCDDGRPGGDDEVLGPRVQRAGVDSGPRRGAELFGPEPDGAGADGVRAVAVAAPERGAEGARVPGVPRAARRRGRGCAAEQAARSRGRFGDAGSADGGRGAGSSAVGERWRGRAAGCRVGVRARPAPAVPGVGGSLPLSRSHGSVRGPLALSGVCVASGAGGGRVPAVFESGVADGGPGPLGRLGRVGSGAESAAGGQQQPLPVAAVGEG